MLIDALRYLANPEDLISKASLIANYQLQVLKAEHALSSCFDILPAEWSVQLLPEAFTSHMETLRLMPLYELLEELFGIFGMSGIRQQDAHLFSFFDAVTEYIQNNSSDSDSFIRYWDETLRQNHSRRRNGRNTHSIHPQVERPGIPYRSHPVL